MPIMLGVLTGLYCVAGLVVAKLGLRRRRAIIDVWVRGIAVEGNVTSVGTKASSGTRVYNYEFGVGGTVWKGKMRTDLSLAIAEGDPVTVIHHPDKPAVNFMVTQLP